MEISIDNMNNTSFYIRINGVGNDSNIIKLLETTEDFYYLNALHFNGIKHKVYGLIFNNEIDCINFSKWIKTYIDALLVAKTLIN